MAVSPRVVNAAIAVAAVTVTSVFFIDFCNLVYRCGCDHLWAARDAHCNIHTPGAKHCPWCAAEVGGGVLVWVAMVVPQAVLAFKPSRWSTGKRFAAALVAFPVIGGILALVMGLMTGYWN